MILFGLLLFLPLVVLVALIKPLLRLLEEIILPFYLGNSSTRQPRPKKPKK
jgi:uncharacterized membrane protein